MASPEQASTQEEFTRALRQLISETGKTFEALAKFGGLAGNTVRGIAEGKNWPQQHTLEKLVHACGQNPKPWVDAWRPINDARPRPWRSGEKELQEQQRQIDALRADVDRLRARVRALSEAQDAGEVGDRRRQRRMEDAYFVFLAEMPHSGELRRVDPEAATLSRASPVIRYAEPAYKAADVERLLELIMKLTSSEDLPKLARELATTPSPKTVNSTPAYTEEAKGTSDYVKSDVDAYLDKLRACLHQYLRDCADYRARTSCDEAGAV
ncbi:hypothetical protein [Streptomyces sp. NPDC059122]|uniref:hypothetical protein n=1 Tax=Streptomyces sp. NPDC059122 TaxID=3346732 RepID=UPI0036A7C65F